MVIWFIPIPLIIPLGIMFIIGLVCVLFGGKLNI